MHERERWQIILRALARQPVATVKDLATQTGASEATLRRDIAKLADQGLLQKVHGGAQALRDSGAAPSLATRPFDSSRALNIAKKRAIAAAAARLCTDGDSIIINGGTTTFEMIEFLRDRRMQILTNSFPIAEALIRNSRNRIILPAGEVYREQSIIVSPYEDDTLRHHYASRMFMGAQGLVPLGLKEGDPLLIRAEQKLVDRAEKLVVLVDSSKFRNRGGLILCPLDRIDTVITDSEAPPEALEMLETAGVKTIVVDPDALVSAA